MLHRLKRPVEAHNKVWLGTIALVVIAALVGALLVFSRISLRETEYQGEFLQAASLRAGDQVTVAGIPVGKVSGLRLAGGHVSVSFKVRDDVHLGSETRAAIKLTTLLGSRYLQLIPSGEGGLAQRLIPLAQTSVPYDLEKTLADATMTFEQVDAERVADSLTILSQSLTGVPEALPQALSNLKALSAIISGRRDQIGALLANADTVTAMVRRQQSTLGSLVVQGRELLGEVTARRAAVQRLFASLTELVQKIRTILNDEPAIDGMLKSMQGLSRMLAEHDALLRNLFQVLPVAIRNGVNMTGYGTAVEFNLPAGPMIDSWMCAISARAKQFSLPQYFQDCQPAPDPFPGWPPPDPARANP